MSQKLASHLDLLLRNKRMITLCLLPMFVCKWIIYKHIICYWFAEKFAPGFNEAFFGFTTNLSKVGVVLECICRTLFFLLLTNYLRAIFSDPGYIDTMNLKQPSNIGIKDLQNKCSHCKIWRPPRAFHCYICNRCVLRMDWHCPSVANCVGAKNYKFFLLSLIYGWLCLIFSILLCIMSLVLWTIHIFSYRVQGEEFLDNVWATALCIFLFLFSVLSLIFLESCYPDNLMQVKTDKCGQERFAMTVRRSRSEMERFKRVFGTNWWAWPLPVAPDLRINTLELSYEMDPSQRKKNENGEDIFEEDELKKLNVYNRYYMR